MMDGDWLIVEARRDDGTPAMFRIRELDPLKHLTKIFVVELPYPKTELSKLPNATDYRRLAELEERWLRPACNTLGWEHVGTRTEDGSFFIYLYGSSDPNAMIEKLSPFDAGLGFYDDDDPNWEEYGTLRELLDQAKAIPPLETLAAQPTVVVARPSTRPSATRIEVQPATRRNTRPTVAATNKPKAKPAAKKPAAKKAAPKPRAKAKKAKAKATKTASRARAPKSAKRR
jgi:hypothetical protein